MLLATDLPLRKDGTVTADVPGDAGQSPAHYTFRPNDAGQVTADIPDDTHVGYLLDTGNFYPADDADGQEAIAIAVPADAHKRQGKAKQKKG